MLCIFSDVSNEQLFFYSYAQTWCSLRRDEYALMLLTQDPHSPPRARINEPTKNFEEFAKAFKCQAGKRMVPADTERCVLW